MIPTVRWRVTRTFTLVAAVAGTLEEWFSERHSKRHAEVLRLFQPGIPAHLRPGLGLEHFQPPSPGGGWRGSCLYPFAQSRNRLLDPIYKARREPATPAGCYIREEMGGTGIIATKMMALTRRVLATLCVGLTGRPRRQGHAHQEQPALDPSPHIDLRYRIRNSSIPV